MNNKYIYCTREELGEGRKTIVGASSSSFIDDAPRTCFLLLRLTCIIYFYKFNRYFSIARRRVPFFISCRVQVFPRWTHEFYTAAQLQVHACVPHGAIGRGRIFLRKTADNITLLYGMYMPFLRIAAREFFYRFFFNNELLKRDTFFIFLYHMLYEEAQLYRTMAFSVV